MYIFFIFIDFSGNKTCTDGLDLCHFQNAKSLFNISFAIFAQFL